LKAAGPLMQSQGIPKEIGGIIQASIVLFVAMKYGIERIGLWLRAKKSGSQQSVADSAVGEEAGV
ncbi:MAG TPA: ABC transporter permease, partial [Spirochaetales bacterium]|nr:ABC transporter permease [Spirochaetales bacterium]